MIVHVYRNLIKDCWSIRHNGKVIKHELSLVLKNATFHVQPAGQKRVRDTGVKNVHAYIKGELIEESEFPGGWLDPIGYDPKKDDTFINRHTKLPIESADFVMFLYPGVFAR